MLDIHSLLDPKCYCPCYCCVQNDSCSCEDPNHANSTTILKKLIILLNDKEARLLITRHILLLNHYFGVTKKTLILQDLPYFCVLLEYLCENVGIEQLYLPALSVLIEMMQTTFNPSAMKDCYEHSLCDYLTTIGYCLKSVPQPKLKASLISAYNMALSKNVPCYSIRYQVMWSEALSESCLPMQLSSLLLTLNGKVYFELLQSIYNILQFHVDSAEDFAVTNCVENILLRWPDLKNLEGKTMHHFDKCAANIILTLLTCVHMDQLKNVAPPSLTSLINLKKWLRWEIMQHDLSRRNDVIAIICRLVCLYSDLDVVNSGLMKDIFLLTFSPLPEIDESWAEGWIFDQDNLHFQRELTKTVLPADIECRELLLMTSKELLNRPTAMIIAKEFNICQGLKQLTKYKCKLKEKKPFIWTQLKFVMDLISQMSDILPNELINYGIPKRLLTMIKYFHKWLEGQGSIFYKSLCCLDSLLQNNTFLPIFRKLDCINTLFSLMSSLVTKCSSWTIPIQESLMLIMISLSRFASQNDFIEDFHEISTVSLSLVLKRISNPRETDSKIDARLILCTFDLVWKTEVLYEKNRVDFVSKDGVYYTLDILEVAVYPVQMVILGFLVDLLEDENAVPHIMLWMSASSGLTFLPLLCKLWRTCEERKYVGRSTSGSMLDIHRPLVGMKNKIQFSNRLDSIPAIMEMSMCMRPKIFCIVSLLLGLHRELVELIEETTHLPFRVLTKSDQITMYLIEYFEVMKEGEIWRDVKKKLFSNGITPQPSEEQLLYILDLKHVFWARKIQCLQKCIEAAAFRKSIDDEQKLYIKIKSHFNPKTFTVYDAFKKRALVEDVNLRAKVKRRMAIMASKPCRKDSTSYKNPTKANVTTELVGRQLKCNPSIFFHEKKENEDWDEYTPNLTPKVSFIVPNFINTDTDEDKKNDST